MDTCFFRVSKNLQTVKTQIFRLGIKSLPLEGTPQGGFSCRFAAIHLQVAKIYLIFDG